ncbi:MAG: phospho-sugar mutase [Clostridiales bacterium]|jgi:phosphoglucomutase|nr:phospho-sugar mutase [Clostridiales bacterium]
MNTVEDKYYQWSSDGYFDENTRKELKAIKGNESEIRERFYTELEFGTAGIRGILGAGTNRINLYVVRRVSYGIAQMLKAKKDTDRGIVIAYDSRHFSYEFARETASVFAGNGIKVFLHREMRPVPLLSFSVRYLKTAAGVMITASHNPKEYNGYKAYGDDGAQLSPQDSDKVLEVINEITDYTKVPVYDFDKFLQSGLIEILDDRVDKAYIAEIKKLIVDRDILDKTARNFSLVYTPLHGTGALILPPLLRSIGFEKLAPVEAQMIPDGDFPTVRVPNPEERDTFDLAMKLAVEVSADLILATDPDADRTGVAVKGPDGDYIILNGNQTGVLLLEYILSAKVKNNSMPKNPFVVSTIVSTRLTERICKEYNVDYADVFTGFKFIGEQIKMREEEGSGTYVFGFEESYGYLPGSYARDKDAVATCMLLAEAATYHTSKGKTLYDALEDIYKKYGYYRETQISVYLRGEEGSQKIKNAMEILRDQGRNIFESLNITCLKDYEKEKVYDYAADKIYPTAMTSVSNVLHYTTDEGWFCVRPSGTEPKLKMYFGARGSSEAEADAKVKDLSDTVMAKINNLLGK